MDDKLITIAEFDTPFEAELAKVRLENEGIEALIMGEDLVANMPTIPVMRVQLQVFERDVERAEAVLARPPEDEEDDSDDDTYDDEDEDWEEGLDEDFEDEESDEQ